MVADLTDLGQTQDALAGADAIVHFAAIPAPQHPARRRDVPDQRAVDLQRLRGGGRARDPARRLGVVGDGPRAAVRHPAGVRADRRDHRAAARDRRIRCRSSSARRWRPSSRGGPPSSSSACGSRTSWSPTITRGSRPGRTTRPSASGTCGATSTPATSRRRRDSPSTRRSSAPRSASSPRRTPSWSRPSADLMAEVFPTVPLRRPVEGRETLLAIDHARRLLGYEPAFRWQEQFG